MAKTFSWKDLPSLRKDYQFFKKLTPIVKKWPIAPEKTALLVLDMNYVCCHQDYGIGPGLARAGLNASFYYERLDSVVIPNIQKLLSLFRRHHMTVVYTTMGSEQADLSDLTFTWRKVYPKVGYHRSLPGSKELEIREEIKPQAGETVIVKKSSGAFTHSALEETLHQAGCDTLIISGVETDCCVYNTAIGAVDLGFKTIVLEDAVTGFTETGHNILLWIYGNLFFFNTRSTGEMIADIEAVAGGHP